MKTIITFNSKILVGFILAISLIGGFGCNQKKLTKSQTSQVSLEQDEEKVYEQVEQMPEFPGGLAELQKFLATNIKYPEAAAKNKTQGKVFVGFVISKDGSVKRVKVVQGVDPLLDAESVRVVNSMPKWTPGKEKGILVSVAFTLPINFALR